MNDSGRYFTNGSTNYSHLPADGQYWSDVMFRTTLFPAFIYMLVLFVIGTLGNSLVCYVYFYKWAKNKTRIFIFALAICDLVNNLVAMPTEMVLLLNFYTFDHPWVCCISRFITFCMNSVSATVLIGIALDRLCGICIWTMVNRFTTKTARYIVFFAFCLALFQSWPVLFLFGTQTVPIKHGPVLKTCSIADKYIGTIQVDIFKNYVLGSNLFYDLALVILYSMVGRNLYRNRSFLRRQDRILRKMSEKAGLPTRNRKRVYKVGFNDDARGQGHGTSPDIVKCLDLHIHHRPSGQFERKYSPSPRNRNPYDVIEMHIFCKENTLPDKKQSVNHEKENVNKGIEIEERVAGIRKRESKGSQTGSNAYSSKSEKGESSRARCLRMQSAPEGISTSYRNESRSTSTGKGSCSKTSSPSKTMADNKQLRQMQTFTFHPVHAVGRRFRSNSCDGRLNLTTKRIGYVHGSTFRKSRTITMLFIITVVFIVSFLPYCIIAIVTYGDKDFYLNSNQTGKISYHLFMRTYFLSSALNPIVYSGFSLKFRKQCQIVFRRVFRMFKFW